VYGTYGKLHEARDNVVLRPRTTWRTSRIRVVIGNGRALDHTKLFLVATDLFGTAARPRPAITPERSTGRDFR